MTCWLSPPYSGGCVYYYYCYYYYNYHYYYLTTLNSNSCVNLVVEHFIRRVQCI